MRNTWHKHICKQVEGETELQFKPTAWTNCL